MKTSHAIQGQQMKATPSLPLSLCGRRYSNLFFCVCFCETKVLPSSIFLVGSVVDVTFSGCRKKCRGRYVLKTFAEFISINTMNGAPSERHHDSSLSLLGGRSFVMSLPGLAGETVISQLLASIVAMCIRMVILKLIFCFDKAVTIFCC